jgi:diguanylate cyclase (GGDEF)-like protein
MKQIKVGTQIARMISLLVLVSALMVIPAVIISRTYKSSVIEEFQQRASIIATMVEIAISQNIEAYRELSEVSAYDPDLFDNTYYERMNALIRQVQAETQTDFIFTEKWIDSQTVAYIFDGTNPSSPDFSPIGSLDTMAPKERESFITGTPTVTKLIKDPIWGNFITAYVPIIDDRDQTVVGLVGVDFSAETINAMSRHMNWIIFGSFLALILLTSWSMVVAMRSMYRASYTDYLTGLASRRYHTLRLKSLVRIEASAKNPFCILMLDIDWFKEINDSRGHAYGDTVLVDTAQAIREHTRSTDVCSRYGGDEFVVLLTSCTLEQANIITQRIMEAIGNLRHRGNGDSPISVSIGLAAWKPGMSEHTIMSHADEALYQAKTQGRSRIVSYGTG